MTEPNKVIYKRILEHMKERYPDARILRPSELEMEFEALNINAMYLAEHGLATINGTIPSRNPLAVIEITCADIETHISGQLTTAGLDYLARDGGLTQELSTVTIRLQADTIRDLVEAKIIESNNISEEDKPRLVAALKGMREEGLKQLTQRLITYGLDQGAATSHNLWQLIFG